MMRINDNFIFKCLDQKTETGNFRLKRHTGNKSLKLRHFCKKKMFGNTKKIVIPGAKKTVLFGLASFVYCLTNFVEKRLYIRVSKRSLNLTLFNTLVVLLFLSLFFQMFFVFFVSCQSTAQFNKISRKFFFIGATNSDQKGYFCI